LNEGQVKGKPIFERVPFLEFATVTRYPHPKINTLSSPRILKTHLPYNVVPKGASEDGKCKYIYVARNPKDVAVSYFKYVTSLKKFGNGYNGPWEFFAKLFIGGNGKFVSAFSSKSPKSSPLLANFWQAVTLYTTLLVK